MADISPYWFIPLLGAWLLFMVTGVRANIVWFEMSRMVGSKELRTWYRQSRGWHMKVVDQFRDMMEHEPDLERRASMATLLGTWQTLYRRCQFLLLAFLVIGAGIFLTVAIHGAA